MSSFVIGKEDYVKAAGLLAGIVSVYPDTFIWDHKADKRMEGTGFYDRFIECFEMNAISVYEQYKHHPDEVLYTDGKDYTETFTAYKAIGKKYAAHPDTLKMMISEIRQFFRSALYQTEKESYSFMMEMLFYRIIDALTPLLYHYEPKSWGSLDLSILDA